MPDTDANDRIQSHLLESAGVTRAACESCLASIAAAAKILVESFAAGRKLLLCGNGGSAADCQHMAAELVSRLSPDLDRPGLPAVALTTDSSFITAFANDCGYDGVFERQVHTLGRPGDVLIGISTSGNSSNVVRAVQAAKGVPMQTITLTGAGGQLSSLGDVSISVPSMNTQYIQETHLAIEHIICDLVEQTLYGCIDSLTLSADAMQSTHDG